MAKGQGRSSGQGVKLLYIREYLYHNATKERPKNNPCDVWEITKSAKTSATVLPLLAFIVIFLAII